MRSEHRTRLEAEYEMLNRLDGKIGDGDLGITLLKAFRELDRIKGELPDDLGQALMKGAGAVSKVSSSSFGTLLATGMMAAAKETKGVTAIPASEVSRLLEKAVAAMTARGKRTSATRRCSTRCPALHGPAGARTIRRNARRARQSGAALDEFRDKPNKIGRARIFADRTIGLDDPGMVAFKMMLDALSPPR